MQVNCQRILFSQQRNPPTTTPGRVGSLVSVCQVLPSMEAKEAEEEDVFGGGGSSEIVSGRQ